MWGQRGRVTGILAAVIAHPRGVVQWSPDDWSDMGVSPREKRRAYLEASEVQVKSLVDRGVMIAGNIASPIVAVKGDLNADERAGGELLGGRDGAALRAALLRLGYAPEDFCACAAVLGDGDPDVLPTSQAGEPLSPELFREAIELIDPEAVILLDDAAASVMREAYPDALAAIEQFEVAMLEPGLVAHVLGRRVLALDGFEASLDDARAKQRMWAYIKQLPPAGAPY